MSSPLGRAEAAALEAVLDPRVALAADELDPAARAALDGRGLLDPAGRDAAEGAVAAAAAGRTVEWATQTLTQGELLASFAQHCAADLDDVEVVESTPVLLVARWRNETSRIELRCGFVGIERLVGDAPTLLVGDVEADAAPLVERFLADARLRERVAVLDPGRLEKIGAVRSSVFVYLEWFLRERYGVKVLPAGAFTQGLIERGIISLGMG